MVDFSEYNVVIGKKMKVRCCNKKKKKPNESMMLFLEFNHLFATKDKA